jgi:hypothetical protein
MELMEKEVKGKDRQSDNVEVTISAGGSVYKNGEFTGTNFHFHVRYFGEKATWIKGSIVLIIQPQNMDLAALQVEKYFREGLYHKFDNLRKFA